MALEVDTLVERRRLKRSRALWRLAAIAAALVLVTVQVGQFDGLPGAHVARITISDVIIDDPAIIEVIDHVAADDSAEALIVAIDSPGGTVTGSEAIYDALRRVGSEKPVVAVMGSMAASGGYVVALAADHILARRNTITGSIGVILQTQEFSELLDKLGISVTEIKSAPLKGEPSLFHPLEDSAREATEALVLDAYNWFIELVAERRALDLAAARSLGDGRVYSGGQAVAAKLIDGLGDEKAGRAWLAAEYGVSARLPVRDAMPAPDLADLWGVEGRAASFVVSLLTGKSLESKRLTLDGLVAIWHPGR